MFPSEIIKTKTFLIAMAVCLAVGFGSGWTVNGWRLGEKLTEKETEIILLQKDIKTQNKAIEQLQERTNEAKERLKKAEEGLKGVRKNNVTRVKQLRSRTTQAVSCEAWQRDLKALMETSR